MDNPKYNVVLPQTDERVLCLQIDRTISKEGYTENFLPRIQTMLETKGEIRILIDFKAYKGWEEEAAMIDMSTLLEYGQGVKKFALVNPPEIMVKQSSIKSHLIAGEIEVFKSEEFDEALEWVRE